MDKDTLRLRLKLVIDQLEVMHSEVCVRAAQMRIKPREMMTPSGELVLTPIFVAQAHALSALTMLDNE